MRWVKPSALSGGIAVATLVTGSALLVTGGQPGDRLPGADPQPPRSLSQWRIVRDDGQGRPTLLALGREAPAVTAALGYGVRTAYLMGQTVEARPSVRPGAKAAAPARLRAAPIALFVRGRAEAVRPAWAIGAHAKSKIRTVGFGGGLARIAALSQSEATPRLRLTAGFTAFLFVNRLRLGDHRVWSPPAPPQRRLSLKAAWGPKRAAGRADQPLGQARASAAAMAATRSLAAAIVGAPAAAKGRPLQAGPLIDPLPEDPIARLKMLLDACL